LDSTSEGVGEGDAAVDVAEDLPEGMVCHPGRTKCPDEGTRAVCRMDGTGWDEYPCDSGKVCDQGFCKELLCTPGQKNGECFGPTSVAVCNDTGTAFMGEKCPEKLTCYKGACRALGCPPGEKACKGVTAVQECVTNSQGEWVWEVTELCQDGLCMNGVCLGSCEANVKESSYLGCDYWAVDLDNIEGGANQPVALVVSVPSGQSIPAVISVTNMGMHPPSALTAADLGVPSMEVVPGALQVFTLPTRFDLEGSLQSSRSFRVTSTSPVTMHQFNPLNGEGVYTNDASLLLPSNVGGTLYLVMSWPLWMANDPLTGQRSYRGFVTVLATQEGVTRVEVSPTTRTLPGANVPEMTAGGGPYTFYLQFGDVLNIEADGGVGSDLTGTRITSDRKVHVFAGHECANVPLNVNYCDHLEQQLFPVHSWGTRYVADAFKPRNSKQEDTWRIMAGAAGVQVTIEPPLAGPYTLQQAGDYVEFTTDKAFEIRATGPVLLGHYLQGSNYPGFSPSCGGTGIGDPAFSLGVPTQQYLKEYIVLTPPGYRENYINVIHRKNTLVDIAIDGKSILEAKPVSLNAVAVSDDSEWAVLQLPVDTGVHTLTGQVDFGVTAYGYDCDVSYAYPGGLSLKALVR
jgi:hypothetical protein